MVGGAVAVLSLGCGAAGPPHVDAVADAAPPDANADARGGPIEGALYAGCRVVTCDEAGGSACCRQWLAFVSDTAEYKNATRWDLVENAEFLDTEIRGAFAFERVRQDGVLGFLLTKSAPLQSLAVQAQVSGASSAITVSVESMRGTAGCQYSLSADGVADLKNPSTCWGDAVFTPTNINLRAEATAAGRVALQIMRVDVRY